MIGDPTKLVIRAKFPRLSAAEIEPFRERSTSFVVDAMDGRGALCHSIKPLDPNSRFVGSALTARAGARDNLAAIAALDAEPSAAQEGALDAAARLLATRVVAEPTGRHLETLGALRRWLDGEHSTELREQVRRGLLAALPAPPRPIVPARR